MGLPGGASTSCAAESWIHVVIGQRGGVVGETFESRLGGKACMSTSCNWDCGVVLVLGGCQKMGFGSENVLAETAI
jgi:hypothetical protein